MTDSVLELIKGFPEFKTPCGDSTLRMECYVCKVLHPGKPTCDLEEYLEKFRLEGNCSTSNNGALCGECASFGWGTDDCSHNGWIAMIYRAIMKQEGDPRKFCKVKNNESPIVIGIKGEM